MKGVREDLPRFVEPMLACTGEPPDPENDAVCGEIKGDGWRIQVTANLGRLVVRTRSGRDITALVPELATVAGDLVGHVALLDGELVACDADGRPSFTRLSSRLAGGYHDRVVARGRACTPVKLYAFDLLHLDGVNTRGLAYRDRRGLLEDLELGGPHCTVAPSVRPSEFDLAAYTREHQLEGAVYKRVDSRYEAGKRSRSWVKVKNRDVERLLVTGWQPANGSQLDRAYLARQHDEGRLERVGYVEFGDAAVRARLREALAEHSHAGRRPIRRVAPGIYVDVAHHGQETGPVRDPIIRDVVIDLT